MPPSRSTTSFTDLLGPGIAGRGPIASRAVVTWPINPSTVLERTGIELRLATPTDALDVFTALDHDSCWTHVRGRPESEDDVVQTVIDATRRGRWMWVVRKHGTVVGTTSYLDVVPADERLEIGFTAYRPQDWASDVNPTCKLLLMDWAFSHGFGRVQFKTDVLNERSQAAIAGLGAVREGVLRQYQRRQDSTIRDTVMYSVVRGEWPAVQEGLLARLS